MMVGGAALADPPRDGIERAMNLPVIQPISSLETNKYEDTGRPVQWRSRLTRYSASTLQVKACKDSSRSLPLRR